MGKFPIGVVKLSGGSSSYETSHDEMMSDLIAKVAIK